MPFRNNFISIHGYIGKTVTETKRNKSGKDFVKYSVGVANQRPDGAMATQWYQVMVFGERAKALIREKRILQGHEVIAAGLHVFQPYRDSTGATRYSNTIFSDYEIINKPLVWKKKDAEALEEMMEIEKEISDQTIEDLEAPF